MKNKVNFSWKICLLLCMSVLNRTSATTYAGNDPHILYMGRVEFIGVQPRLWTAGAYLRMTFIGDTCKVVLEDELLYSVQHNYMEVQVDEDAPVRLRLNNKVDTIYIIPRSKRAKHEAIVCKDTETGIGYVGVQQVIASQLLEMPNRKKRLFEFWGDSITCGTSSDTSAVGCKKGRWEDQHNAYMSYGAQTARKLDADWTLSAVSGIGLMHSCCNMNIIMPQVWNKMDMRNDSIPWDFHLVPDVVFVCLGQNDGLLGRVQFQYNYIAFLLQLRSKYPQQPIVLLNSPMANKPLRTFLKKEINDVIKKSKKQGISNLYSYSYKKSYNGGCDAHPSINENNEISDLLVGYLQKQKGIL